MTAIEKVKEALDIGLSAVLSAGWTRYQENDATAIREALAALDAEKPVEDAYEVLWKLGRTVMTLSNLDVNEHQMLDLVRERDEKRAIIIQQYAEAYHERKCAECKDMHLDDMRHGCDCQQNQWKDMKTAPWGKEVLLTGDSGYNIHSEKFIINGYREKNWHQGEWNDATGTHLSERGWVPTQWKEL